MRRRAKSICFRVTQEELDYIRSQAQKGGVTVQEYLRRLVRDKPIHEKPPREFHKVLKNLRQINNNMNQVAAKANTMNFIDTAKYWANVSDLQKTVGKLMEEMYMLT